MTEAEQGTAREVWSVATGKIRLLSRKSRQAAEYMNSLDGFAGLSIVEDGRCLWFYDSQNAAIRARNLAESQGIQCGKNVCRFLMDEDGVAVFADEMRGNDS